MVCSKLKGGSCGVLKNPCKKKYIAKMTGKCPVNKGGKAIGKKKAKKAAKVTKAKGKKAAKKKKRK